MWGASKWGVSRWGMETSTVVGAGGWNKDWAERYGPDKNKQGKDELKKATLKRAIKVIKSADLFPDEVADVKSIVEKRDLKKRLAQEPEIERRILVAYYAFIQWKKREEDDAKFLLLAEMDLVENLKKFLLKRGYDGWNP